MIYRSCPWFRIEIFNLLLLLRPNRLSLWNYDELTQNMLVLANSVPFHFLKKPMNKKISFYDEGIFIQIRNSNVYSLRVLIFLHCNHDFLHLSLLPVSFQWNRCKLRSGRLKVFCIKGILKNFEKFIGKHLCRSVFLIKCTASSLQRYWKGRSGSDVFLWTLRTFYEYLFWTTPWTAASGYHYIIDTNLQENILFLLTGEVYPEAATVGVL